MEMVFRWVEMGSTPHNTDLRLGLDGGAHPDIWGRSPVVYANQLKGFDGMNKVFGEIFQQCADKDKLSSSLFSDSPDCHADQ